MKQFLIAATLLASTAAHADFMPKNDLHLQDNLESTAGITEQAFNDVIDRAEAVFGPLVAQFGATLTVERNWSDGTVNAFASQPTPTTWKVAMFGGLARRAEVTEDGFAMVVCHEIGHHIGGHPFTGARSFAANEGQSDIFATGACAFRLFGENDDLSVAAVADIPAAQKRACDEAHKDRVDRDICYRAVVAGKSLADLLGALGGTTANYDTPDTRVVTRTNNAHPAAQCRLDTYIAGALCGYSRWDYSLIPGKNNTDRNSPAAQTEAFAHSCVAGVGARPRCWFAAQ